MPRCGKTHPSVCNLFGLIISDYSVDGCEFSLMVHIHAAAVQMYVHHTSHHAHGYATCYKCIQTGRKYHMQLAKTSFEKLLYAPRQSFFDLAAESSKNMYLNRGGVDTINTSP